VAYTWTSSHEIFTSGIMVIMGSDYNLGWDIIIAGSYFGIIKLTNSMGQSRSSETSNPSASQRLLAF
jgi:hypothetical protein